MIISKKKFEAALEQARRETEERFLMKEREDAFRHDVYSDIHRLEKKIALFEDNAKKRHILPKKGMR